MADEPDHAALDHILCAITWEGEAEPEDTDASLSMRRTPQRPTGQPSLFGAELRHARAKKHIRDVRQAITRYVNEFDVAPENAEFKKGETHHMKPVPLAKLVSLDTAFGVLLGEAVYNLRAALDYLIYELAWLDSGEPQEGTQFPIEKNPELFKGRVTGSYVRKGRSKKIPCGRYLAGVSPTHVQWIERFQPYDGCEWTKTLQGLSNPDKHRRILDLGSAIRAGWTPLGPPVETEAGLVMDVELKYTPFISIDGIDLGNLLGVLQQEVGNVLALFRPEFQSASAK